MNDMQHHFTSAPTVDRNFVRMLLSIAQMRSFNIASCDITQAFLQSTRLAQSDKYIAVLPPYVVLDDMVWRGEILDHSPVVRGGPSFALMCHRPLYGSRCAPLRWYLTIAGVLKRLHFRCHRSDVCVFFEKGYQNGPNLSVFDITRRRYIDMCLSW